jgi:aquaporin TIP
MTLQLGFEPGDVSGNNLRGAAAEFIALVIFVFVGAGAVVVFQNIGGDDLSFIIGVALAHGLAIALLVAATAKISGGFINPAVTFSAALTGKLKVSVAVLYIVAQCAGAVVGALLLKMVLAGPVEMSLGAHGISVFEPGVGGGLLDNQAGDGAGAALIVEMVLTFVLVFVVFATAMDPRGPTSIAPIAIGLAILVDHFVGVPLTGASMNPARSFGPAIVANEWSDHWIYWLGPAIGGGIAALVYEYIFMNRPDET